jgi:hypothetical protein
VPADRIIVAESGLHAPQDLADLARYGARCFLIGESLMRQADVAAATRALLANPLTADGGPERGHVMALTHFDAEGRAHMVDVSDKPVTTRTAVATGRVRDAPETLALSPRGTARRATCWAWRGWPASWPPSAAPT